MSLVQHLAWPARCTCPQLAYDAKDSQQKTHEAKMKDLVHLNHIVQHKYDLADQGHKLMYKRFQGEPLHVAVFDASWGRQTKNRSQLGFEIGVGPVSMGTKAATVHLLEWNGTLVHRKTKSTLAAEGAAGSVGFLYSM